MRAPLCNAPIKTKFRSGRNYPVPSVKLWRTNWKPSLRDSQRGSDDLLTIFTWTLMSRLWASSWFWSYSGYGVYMHAEKPTYSYPCVYLINITVPVSDHCYFVQAPVMFTAQTVAIFKSRKKIRPLLLLYGLSTVKCQHVLQIWRHVSCVFNSFIIERGVTPEVRCSRSCGRTSQF